MVHEPPATAYGVIREVRTMFGSSILAMDFTVTLMIAALALLVVILVVSAILDRGDSAQDRRDL
jgi:hypothetical protein